ncbi:alpha/beta hydrolase [Synechococcus sp. HK05]|uniref:alpha/beta hydrolase n=1 Tax=Synechococcus sp. HK05 TaxID=2725975 RepID=UPI001C38652B|nr:alpha/beta hydrolase [Synechococcus sp. HK05]MBV2352192.1 alpha/beta hydrolase [Synechococcus sp. HK05]
MPISKRQRLTAAVLSLGLIGSSPAAIAAENVVFVTGAFRRSIAVTDLEYLADTGQARGLIADVLLIAKQKPEEVSKLLKAELSIPLLLTSRLLSTRLGEALLARIAQIIYPLYAKRAGIPALRAGVINALVATGGKLSAISFLKAYPVDEMEVSIPALLAVLQKAKSVSELIQFFMESPLDGLRGNSAASGGSSAPQKPAP